MWCCGKIAVRHIAERFVAGKRVARQRFGHHKVGLGRFLEVRRGVSPSFFSQRTTCPSSIVGDSASMWTLVAIRSRSRSRSRTRSRADRPIQHPIARLHDPLLRRLGQLLEALRVGADVFASDLNPIPVLLNRVLIEYIPGHGAALADKFEKLAAEVEKEFQRSSSLENSYHLVLNDGEVHWQTKRDGELIVLDREPETNLMQRLYIRLLALLPFKSQL